MDSRNILTPLCFSLLLICHLALCDPLGPVQGFVQVNLVGLPVIHETTKWVFDPDVALKRRRQFIELHGDKGEKLIERLGLGIDGNDEQRLEQQRKRDEGHLGGLNYYLP